MATESYDPLTIQDLLNQVKCKLKEISKIEMSIAMTLDGQESIEKEIEEALDYEDHILDRIFKIQRFVDIKYEERISYIEKARTAKGNQSSSTFLAGYLEQCAHTKLAENNNAFKNTVAATNRELIALDSSQKQAEQDIDVIPTNELKVKTPVEPEMHLKNKNDKTDTSMLANQIKTGPTSKSRYMRRQPNKSAQYIPNKRRNKRQRISRGKQKSVANMKNRKTVQKALLTRKTRNTVWWAGMFKRLIGLLKRCQKNSRPSNSVHIQITSSFGRPGGCYKYIGLPV